MRDQLWHHECAARLITEEAEGTVEASLAKGTKPPSRVRGCAVLALQLSLLFIWFPLLGLIAGSLIGLAGGILLGLWLNYEIKLLTDQELSWLPWVLAPIGALVGAWPGAQSAFRMALELLDSPVRSETRTARTGKRQKSE